MPWHQIKIEVVKILEGGTCPRGHRPGETYNWPDDQGELCAAASHVLYPYIIGLQTGGSFPWEENPDVCTICCPDYKNPVVFKLTRGEAIE
ncbi:MAG: TIGR04076 family protein [Candidatus Hodarchaeota archaeon]